MGGKILGGCSNVPDISADIKKACDNHDPLYEKGGTEDDRLQADKKLKDDIEKSGHPIIAKIYYEGVRQFGSNHFNYHK